MTNKTWLLQLTDLAVITVEITTVYLSTSYRLKLCENLKISPFLNKIFDWIVSQVKLKKKNLKLSHT